MIWVAPSPHTHNFSIFLHKEIMTTPTLTHPRPNSLTTDYEFRVYDSGSHGMEYASCPIVVMSRHEGFHWNEDLFVSAYRRGEGYESRKSIDRERRQKRVCRSVHKTTSKRPQQSSDPEDQEVLEIILSESECDVYPETA